MIGLPPNFTDGKDMQYVFFDIECACVYRTTAKICAFGYCLTDDQFNILKKEDILINPKGKFHLTDRKGEAGIVLPYDYQGFKNQPLFPEVFPQIRALLEGEDKRVFGHATFNDVKYLNLETKRFRLPSLKFSFFDTQLLYMSLINSFERQLGLESIAQALGVEFTPHRAADDAYATMRVAQAMCEKEGLSMEALLQKYAVRPGKTASGSVMGGTSGGMEQFLAEKKREKDEREKKHLRFCRLIERKSRSRATAGIWKDRVFTFSREIEEDYEAAKEYLEGVYSCGGRYTMKIGSCDVYVRAAEDDGRRYQNALSAGKEILSVEQFLSLLTEGNA